MDWCRNDILYMHVVRGHSSPLIVSSPLILRQANSPGLYRLYRLSYRAYRHFDCPTYATPVCVSKTAPVDDGVEWTRVEFFKSKLNSPWTHVYFLLGEKCCIKMSLNCCVPTSNKITRQNGMEVKLDDSGS